MSENTPSEFNPGYRAVVVGAGHTIRQKPGEGRPNTMSSDVIVAARLNAKSQVSSKFLFKLPNQSQVLIGPTDKSKLLFARSENPTKNKVKALLLLSHNPRTLLNSSGAIPLQVPPKLWPILCQGAGPLDWSGSVIKKIAVMSVPGIVPVTPAASGEVGLVGPASAGVDVCAWRTNYKTKPVKTE
ncbi:hypothetical protein C8F01DRAFT_1231863 [Mycena amicta]|nr:hypothetical protein C8F01DRAFT_1231863 [Mycena amicta]